MKSNKSTMAMARLLGRMQFFPPNRFRGPHQGKRECARRLRTHQESKTRRMWVLDVMVRGASFGQYKCSRRAPLARLHFHKKLHCQIVLEDGKSKSQQICK